MGGNSFQMGDFKLLGIWLSLVIYSKIYFVFYLSLVAQQYCQEKQFGCFQKLKDKEQKIPVKEIDTGTTLSSLGGATNSDLTKFSNTSENSFYLSTFTKEIQYVPQLF